MLRIVSVALLLSQCISVNSADATLVVPGDLQPGDSYQLVFVTQGTRNSGSPLIGDYNAFVQGEANRPGAITENYGINWFAIASTFTVDARDNAAVIAPVYLLDGTRIADGSTDLWDGTIGAPIRIDQFGQQLNTEVWTGSETDGTASSSWPIAGGTFVWSGSSNLANAGWIRNFLHVYSEHKSLYALSEPLTVPQSPAAVPEPTAIVVWSCLTCALVARHLIGQGSPKQR